MNDKTNYQECTVRLLQNGRYVWTITVNTPLGDGSTVEQIKKLDGVLRDQFPNHVKETGIKFHEIENDE